jgi:hypothetical protein
MLIVLILAITFTAGLGTGVLIVKVRKKKSIPSKKQKVIRKGLLKLTIHWKEWHQLTGWNKRKSEVVAILHELERVASQSRVLVAHIDNTPEPVIERLAINKIGKYVETDKIEWHKPIKYEPEDIHTEIDKYIKRLEKDAKSLGHNHQYKEPDKVGEG